MTVKSDDTDEEQQNIKTQTGKDIQSSDDNALPFMNLLILEGLAQDPSVHIPDSADIVRLCQEIRSAINLKRFVINDRIIHNYTNGDPMGEWDRISAEGAIILMALMLSNQITQQEFEDIAASLKNHLVNWDSLDSGVIKVGKPSYHSAMFIHGLRAIHGLPVTPAEFNGAHYFEESTKPVFKAHLDYAEHYGYKALGSQVMTQELEGIPLVEFDADKQVQFPGNEDNLMPIPGQELDRTLSRATGPHAWFIPLARWRYLEQQHIDKIFAWMLEYETKGFFHSGSDIELGWEAAIPWTPDDKTFAWQASDGTWKYTDWGRPYEALNTAYIVLSIFDALNPDAPLASYNVEAERTQDIIAYFDKFEIFVPLIIDRVSG